MSSPYQRTTTDNQDSMDEEQSYITSSQVGIYGPAEDRRMQSGALSGHEMIGIHSSGDNGSDYRYEPEHSSDTRRRHRRAGRGYVERTEFPGYEHPSYDLERFSNGDNNPYGNSTGSPRGNTLGRIHTHGNFEYRGRGYEPDGFENDNNNPYDKYAGAPRAIINDRVDARANAEYLAASHHRTDEPRPYTTHATADFEQEVETDNNYENSEVENEEISFVQRNDRKQKKRHPKNKTSPEVGRPVRSGNPSRPERANPRIRFRPTGVEKRLNVNLIPPTVPTSSISDAALLKRGLKRSKKAVMSKKPHGPNDPENILIVNLRENEDKSWPDISLILNERRIKEGRSPSFTANGCHNRYNRNAPILFAAEGKEFIPVHMQRKLKKNPAALVAWTDETDTLLIRAVKEVESRKWDEVADIFNTHGPFKITAAEAALRTKVI